MSNNTPEDILPFYQGQSPDSKGRMIEEIWSWDYQRLEYTHDYIQWLFPLEEPSQFNWRAPVVDDNVVHVFWTNEQLRMRLLHSFKVMLQFYGLQCNEINGRALNITKSDEYPQRKSNWIEPNNHNYLRITRILTSLRLLGLENYSLAFFNCLNQIYLEEGETIGYVTYSYWERAVN